MTVGFEYGNTRLRVRRGRLLEREEYGRLSRSTSLERLLGALAATDYGPDVEAALPRFRGLRVLDESLRSNLARSVRELRGFYPPDSPELDLLLERFDVRNLRTIIRAQARLLVGDQITPLLIPAGVLTDAQLAELAVQPGIRATIDLMVAWGVPSRATARRVLHRWPEYEETGAAAVLEGALNDVFARRIARLADRGGPAVQLVGWEIDATNLLTALRLREAEQDGEPRSRLGGVADYLPPMFITAGALSAVEVAPDAARVVSIVTGLTGILPAWRTAFADWQQHGSLVDLAEDLDGAISRWAIRLFSSGDPLGLAVPVGYLRAKETEIRNLRLVGRGIINGLLPSEIDEQLVVL